MPLLCAPGVPLLALLSILYSLYDIGLIRLINVHFLHVFIVHCDVGDILPAEKKIDHMFFVNHRTVVFYSKRAEYTIHT